MAADTHLTPRGAATRARIVEAAADLVLARGVGGTSLDDIRAGTATSKSQLFHYFPGGKSDLIGAIAAFQSERVLEAQRPFLGALASELIGTDPARAAEVAAHMDRWRGYLRAGLRRMLAAGLLRAGSDPEKLSLAI